MRKNAKGAEEKKRSQETKKMEFMETKFNENDEKESLWKKNTQKPTKNGEKPKYVVTKGNKHDTMTMKIKLCTERSWALQDMIASIAYILRSHKRSESAKKVRLFSSPAGTDFGTTWRKSCKKQMKNKSPKGYPFVCYEITNKPSLCAKGRRETIWKSYLQYSWVSWWLRASCRPWRLRQTAR